MIRAVREWLAEIGTRGSKTGTFSASIIAGEGVSSPQQWQCWTGGRPKQSPGK